MAVSIHRDAAGRPRHDLTPASALRQAWYWYLSLLMVPFALFIAVVVTLNYHSGTPENKSMISAWFIAPIAFLIVAGPIAFAIRSRLFKSYWRGEGVDPRHYLMGMLIVWFTFEIGGIVSLIGCLASNALVPCLLPALAALMFFWPLWPSGNAMGRPAGNTDDPEIYKEPS